MAAVPKLILASASPRRDELLRQLGVDFEVVPSSVSELHDARMTVLELCEINAARKAESVANEFPEAVVLGADTLVTQDGQLYGKPGSVEEAHRMLGALQGRGHQVITGVSLMQICTNRAETFSVATDVTFHRLSVEQIRTYTKLVNVLDKAGAYAIQEHGEMIVEKICGSFSNVVGLPLEELAARLKGWGFQTRR